ncbi:hypothetical protein ACPPVO_34815 [Dactylosporangium sp. McL0621]|uniref:hypothetical protein n=1 Tax=Dactylosporangium sp. McL0621 TaxID=3415678 RepID=UPI003CFA2EAC
MAELLDGVGEVDWSTLRHAYGSAGKVPSWLAAMTDPATSGDALDDLDSAVYHQGGAVYSAGAAVVPFLIRFARDPAVPDRSDILDLVRRFAALHNQMQEPWKSKPHALTCRAALLAAFDSLVHLLDEPDPALRRGAARILIELGERADQVAGELTRRQPDEADADVAADYVLALGTLGAAAAMTPGRRAAVAAWLSEHTPPPGDPRRLTFLVAARRFGHDAVTAEHMLDAYADAVPQRTVGWLGRELGTDRTARIALARIGIGQALRTQQQQPLAEVGAVMWRWRSATTELAADVAAALDGPQALQAAVVHLLAAAGNAAHRWSEEVAALIGRPGRTTALAAWALARWGDHRAVPFVQRSLRRDPEMYDIGSSHYTDEFYWLEQGPAIADVCLPLAPHADELVPAVRTRLREDPTTPTAFQLTRVLAAYGTAATAAMPELTAMLDTQHPELACTVLAGLGPAAAPALARLTRLATSDEGTATPAAWALFRITGDPEPFLARQDVLATERLTGPPARMLGDLGPLAGRYAPNIEQRLMEQPQLWCSWQGVELGYADYRITGDPALCLDVFDAALDPLRHSRQLPVSLEALRYTARLGRAAARFTPLLHGAATQDERLLYSGGWRGIAEDDEAQSLANQALTAVTL